MPNDDARHSTTDAVKDFQRLNKEEKDGKAIGFQAHLPAGHEDRLLDAGYAHAQSHGHQHPLKTNIC